ncbi:MAG: rRNA maturation RNase YbeY [Thermosynechococcaceae cyanobacterium MS004]|nr:rRNA maturation RNase YbeY [Thermosynechococcaceae cyanobacterium MS004]
MIQVELTLQVEPIGTDGASISFDETAAGLSEQQWQDWFEQWLDYLSPEISPANAYEVSLLLTTDADIQHLNKTYRQQNAPTDVLAFAALEWTGPALPAQEQFPVNLGDIIISVETAQVQAGQHSLAVELAWLAAHGLLHLLGWDHPDIPQLQAMLKKQAQLLQHVGLEAPDWSTEDLGY